MHMNTLTRIIFIIIFLSFCCPVILAQEVGIQIHPTTTKAVVKPGKSFVVTYSVTNIGDPVAVSARVLPFKEADSYGNVSISYTPHGPITFKLQDSSVSLDKQLLLDQQQTQKLQLKVLVPQNTPEGDYYYTFVIQSHPQGARQGGINPQIQAMVGSHLLLTVTSSGKVDIAPQIIEFTPRPTFTFSFFGTPLYFFESNDPVLIDLIVRNGGRNLIVPTGKVSLLGSFGTRASYDIIRTPILANTHRRIMTNQSSLIKNSTAPSLALTGFFVGKYTVNASINFGEGAPALFATTSFIAIPIKLLIALVAASLLGMLIFKKFNS